GAAAPVLVEGGVADEFPVPHGAGEPVVQVGGPGDGGGLDGGGLDGDPLLDAVAGPAVGQRRLPPGEGFFHPGVEAGADDRRGGVALGGRAGPVEFLVGQAAFAGVADLAGSEPLLKGAGGVVGGV